jgi:hypothetical protein
MHTVLIVIRWLEIEIEQIPKPVEYLQTAGTDRTV